LGGREIDMSNGTMRAALYRVAGTAAEVLRLESIAIPEPGAGEVRVRVMVSGVNPHDTKKRSGWTGQGLPTPFVIPHSDGAGVIEAVGEGVAAARIGERVWFSGAGEARAGEGAAATFTIVEARRAIPLPAAASFDVGACLGVPAMTAHRALFADGAIAGKTVLVTGGAGAVGAYAIQLATLAGARVVATVSTPEKATLARRLGAIAAIDYPTEDVVAGVRAAVRAPHVDRIVEVDFGANQAACHALIAPNGTVAAYSSTRVREPVLDYYAFARKGATLRFVQGMLLTPGMVADAVATLTPLLAADKLIHPIAVVFPFERIAEAHALLESGASIGKVLVAGPE
jgi:NADPH:quinone reductase